MTRTERAQRKEKRMVLFRRLLGEVLRSQRMRQGRTLREVSADARVSLGYISEIERGQKEASSELLASLCAALDVPLSEVLSEVSDAVALEEAALAMQLEDVTLDTTGLSGRNDAGTPDSGPRRGDVVASAA
jgi:transcriptional regulator with XRE-family HTH domain